MKNHYIIKIVTPAGESRTIKIGSRTKLATVRRIAEKYRREFGDKATAQILETETFRGMQV